MDEAIIQFQRHWPSSLTLLKHTQIWATLFFKKGAWTRRSFSSKRRWQSGLTSHRPQQSGRRSSSKRAEGRGNHSFPEGAGDSTWFCKSSKRPRGIAWCWQPRRTISPQRSQSRRTGRTNRPTFRREEPRMAATLAAAYAEAGRFSEAIAPPARRAIGYDQNDAPLAAALQAQLKSYQADSPFRDLNTPR